jgi:hypothetical protein
VSIAIELAPGYVPMQVEATPPSKKTVLETPLGEPIFRKVLEICYVSAATSRFATMHDAPSTYGVGSHLAGV